MFCDKVEDRQKATETDGMVRQGQGQGQGAWVQGMWLGMRHVVMCVALIILSRH